MNTLGFLCRAKDGEDPIRTFSPFRLYRIIVMSRELEKLNTRLFVYSPSYVNSITKMASGYAFIDDRFIPVAMPVPRINGDWYLGTSRAPDREGMGYKKLLKWADENKINYYVRTEFSQLINDKKKAHDMISKFDSKLNPMTENFIFKKKQLEKFLEVSPTVFFKPVGGSQGNGIIVLNKAKKGFSITSYNKKQQSTIKEKSISSVMNDLQNIIKEREYILQQGIKSVKHNSSVCDVRVIMLFDGAKWQWINHMRMGAKDSDLSNFSQGGTSEVPVDEVLENIFGKQESVEVMKKIKKLSFELAEYLDSFNPSEIMEIAFDLLIDYEQNIYLAEINAKPGIWYRKPFKNILKLTAEEQLSYDSLVKPHATYLAKFLYSKLRESN